MMKSELTHRMLWLIAMALTLLSLSGAAHARIRSADAIGQCLDAEGGPKNGGRVIAWPCYYTPGSNNQQFVLDWLNEAESRAAMPSHKPYVRKLALIRVGNLCLSRTRHSSKNELALTNDCPKSGVSNSHWAPVHLEGNRFSIRDYYDSCLLLWGGSAEALNTLTAGRHQEVRLVSCTEAGQGSVISWPEHFWQFWYVEQ
jgi:hypothetical protein